ncbi:MAG: DUF5677 domain-containing protein [Terriglobales bacterium]
MFKAVLKASLARIHAYAEFAHSEFAEAGPQSFFGSAPLRQCCEDLIVLKYLAKLGRRDRDAVIGALMVLEMSTAVEKQRVFFERSHPYQLVIQSNFSPDQIGDAKGLLDKIGVRTCLWHTQGRLPPVKQMAATVGLSEMYEYLYAATSELVHFNVRISLRSGWGNDGEFSFSPANFAKFYTEFSKTYAAYVWIGFCRVFRSAIGLSPGFMDVVDGVELAVESVYRWPELVTFEEMNVPQGNRQGNLIFRACLFMMQDERVKELCGRHAKRKAEDLRSRRRSHSGRRGSGREGDEFRASACKAGYRKLLFGPNAVPGASFEYAFRRDSDV